MGEFYVVDDTPREPADTLVYQPKAQSVTANPIVPAQTMGSSAADALAACVQAGADVTITISRPRRVGTTPEQSSFGKAFMITIGIIVALAVAGFASGFIQGFIVAVQKPLVTRAQYDQIETGMSYERVVGIIGSTPTQSGASASEGFGNLIPPTHAAVCVWRNPDQSAMLGMFLNDHLTTKVQQNLK
jgi:hypothetical protein